MSKYEEANLILKLYELRREETMRTARDWFFREFNPESLEDVNKVMFSERSGHLRMVLTYWDMAAALVNQGAISMEMFNETNGEHFSVYAKTETILNEARTSYGPQFLANLQKLIEASPNGLQRTAAIRERMKKIRAQLATRQNDSAS
jgi:hypothetical protein